MPARRLGAQPLALLVAAAKAGHLGRGPGLNEKDQTVRFKPHLRLADHDPGLARPFDAGVILFARQQSFFVAIAVADEPARERSGFDLRVGGGGECRR